MRNIKKKNSKTNFIILFIVLVLAIAVGYAAFNENLTITGTANAKGNFDVVFSNAELVPGLSEGIDVVNSSATIDQTDSDTVAIIAKDLNSVNSHANYTITIQNLSSTRAKINSLTVNGLNSSIFSVTGYETAYNTILAANDGQTGGSDEVTFPLVVALKSGAEITAANVEASFTLSMEYVEAAANDTRTASVSSASVSDFLTSASSVTAGGTVTVTDDITFDAAEYPTSGHVPVAFPDNATLNLGGNTITSPNGALAYTGNGLTIKNGEFVGLISSSGGRYGLQVWNNNNNSTEVSRNVVIENVTTTGICLYNAEVTLRNVTVTMPNDAKFYTVYGNVYTTIAIESGTYTAGAMTTALLGYCEYDSTEVGKATQDGRNPSDGFKIYGGTFNTNGKPFYCTSANHIPPVIYGGTFDCDVTDYCAAGYKCDDNGNGTYTVHAQ